MAEIVDGVVQEDTKTVPKTPGFSPKRLAETSFTLTGCPPLESAVP
jgi:hypothetical protein